MLERVLIPLDGTADAESVIPLLEPVLHRLGSEIFLVQALEPPTSSAREGSYQEADRYLKGVADRLLDEGDCVHTLVGVGPPPQVIESLAAGEEVTLIAMPARGDALGPVGERLLRRSSRTILALHPPAEGRVSRKSARRHRTILAPLDGSQESRASLPLALELAGVLDARVILMRVIEQDAQETEAVEDLHDVAQRLNRQGLFAEIWIEAGDPAAKILQVSRDEGVEMVVMTARGRSRPDDSPFGRVTRRLLQESPVPVLAVHSRGGLP
jgi:nucleotide-binding universal stress UspA family protein